MTQDEAGQSKGEIRERRRNWTRKILPGREISISWLVLCLPTIPLLLQEGNGVTAGTFLTLSRGSSSSVTLVDIGDHFFLFARLHRTTSRAPTNLIVKPGTEATSMTRKRQQERIKSGVGRTRPSLSQKVRFPPNLRFDSK